MEGKISQLFFWEQSQGVSWRGAQVHRSRKRGDMGLFRGLGIVFKDLSRCIKGKEAGKWSWTFIILSKSASWLSWNREPRFFGIAGVLQGRAGTGTIHARIILSGFSAHCRAPE